MFLFMQLNNTTEINILIVTYQLTSKTIKASNTKPIILFPKIIHIKTTKHLKNTLTSTKA